MTKAAKTVAKKKPQTKPRATNKRGQSSGTTGASQSPAGPRAETKGARVIAMLSSPAGATIEGMMQATGWQPHSVRGFLAGVVRKKLNLELQSTKSDGRRIYRIDTPEPPAASTRRGKRSAG